MERFSVVAPAMRIYLDLHKKKVKRRPGLVGGNLSQVPLPSEWCHGGGSGDRQSSTQTFRLVLL